MLRENYYRVSLLFVLLFALVSMRSLASFCFYYFSIQNYSSIHNNGVVISQYSDKLLTDSLHQHILDCWTGEGGIWKPGRTGHDLFTWVPPCNCTMIDFPPLTAATWCSVYNGRNLLLIGDSLTQQVYVNTIALLQSGLPSGSVQYLPAGIPFGCDSRIDIAPFQHGCNVTKVVSCNASVAFVRNDHVLLDTTARIWDKTKNVFLHPFGHAINAFNPFQIILNRGAHYVANDSVFENELRTTLSKLKIMAPKAYIALRNTPMGHKNCSAYRRPLVQLPPGLHNDLPYFWGNFPRQNAIMRRVASDTGVVYLDYAYSTQFRPDGHPPNDCLHYILLGSAVPTWVRFNLAAASLRSLPVSIVTNK